MNVQMIYLLFNSITKLSMYILHTKNKTTSYKYHDHECKKGGYTQKNVDSFNGLTWYLVKEIVNIFNGNEYRKESFHWCCWLFTE